MPTCHYLKKGKQASSLIAKFCSEKIGANLFKASHVVPNYKFLTERYSSLTGEGGGFLEETFMSFAQFV